MGGFLVCGAWCAVLWGQETGSIRLPVWVLSCTCGWETGARLPLEVSKGRVSTSWLGRLLEVLEVIVVCLGRLLEKMEIDARNYLYFLIYF